MHPKVRDLYKRFIIVGRNYPHPLGIEYVRNKVKKEFVKNKDVNNEVDILKLIAYGRFIVREMKAVISLHKYRALRNR